MTDEYISKIEEITGKDQRNRMLEIVRIMRRHDFVRNFMKQQNPEEVRFALEELGPTFIKGGQILSTRPDLISPAFISEFKKLQDDVQIDSFESVSKTFREQTGKNISDVFDKFDEKPFASASIGQTHHAVLKNGTQVVVKVQHPKIKELVETDLTLFRQALKILKLAPEITVVDPEEILNQLQASLLNEINTEIEIKNGLEFYRLNNRDGIIEVPVVYEEYSTQKILVNSRMDGESIKKLAARSLSDDPTERKLQKKERTYIADALVKNFIKQVFVDNFFHADPHPGNILFYRLKQDDPRINELEPTHEFEKKSGSIKASIKTEQKLPPYRLVYLDFGMMGRLSPLLAEGIANVIVALSKKDTQEISQAVLSICNRTGEIDEEDFTDQLGIFLTPYLKQGLGQIDFPVMLYNIIKLCRKNNLQVKPEVTLLIKAFGSLEGIVAQLDPDLSLMDVARPFAKEYFKRKFNWKNELDEDLMTFGRAVKSTPQIPIKIEKLLDTLNQGRGRFTLRFKGQDTFIDRIETIVNRLIITIILASIILSSSLLVQGSMEHPAIYNIGVAGYMISFVVIIWMVASAIWHHFKK